MGAGAGRTIGTLAPEGDGVPGDESVRVGDQGRLNWVIRFGGHTWRPDTLDVATLITIGEYVGVDEWSTMNPTSGPKVLAAYLTILVAKARDVPLEHAMAVVLKMTPDELLDTVEIE